MKDIFYEITCRTVVGETVIYANIRFAKERNSSLNTPDEFEIGYKKTSLSESGASKIHLESIEEMELVREVIDVALREYEEVNA